MCLKMICVHSAEKENQLCCAICRSIWLSHMHGEADLKVIP
nr:MAG TPA_asm: hypothetical protein [Caudoviricetes sp.]